MPGARPATDMPEDPKNLKASAKQEDKETRKAQSTNDGENKTGSGQTEYLSRKNNSSRNSDEGEKTR
ncbi:hypothetical protein LTS08_007937 [Lithohypha guttulata]|nr:hypothetical protein LTS08_007937 [Lithohypha guttulata]